jgi:T4 RnlA family RNA ligase
MANKFYIPSYQEAVDLVNKTGSLTFYESIQYIDGYKISVFNYRLATYNDFVENNAYELRGLTYVFNLDGTVFKTFRLLHKFFNLNQVAETQFDLVKDLKIDNVTNKEDGSVINFIKLPNGRVLAKSKMTIIDNTQSLMAQEIYESNPAIKKLVDFTLENNMVAVFELVSPFNRVVLKYTQTELILIRLRTNTSGEYLPLEVLGDILDGVKTPKVENFSSWDDMLSIVDIAENIEGWVVQCGSDLIKVKTKWYCDRHHLLTDFIRRPDFIIEKILDEQIDDILGQLTEDEVEVKSFINNVVDRVNNYLMETLNDINSKMIEFKNTFNSDVKMFAVSNHKTKNFGLYMSVINGKDDAFKVVVRHLKKKTYHLSKAYEFVETGNV